MSMPARSCFSHSCEFNFMKYLFKDWNLLQKTTKIVGFFQDTTYNHRCLANPFLLLQSLYSLKMALSSAFPFASALYMPVLYHLKKKKKREKLYCPFWHRYHTILKVHLSQIICRDRVQCRRSWHCQSGVKLLLDHQFSQRMASTVLKTQKVNTFDKRQLQLSHTLIFKDPGYNLIDTLDRWPNLSQSNRYA